jgi:hypothetical protein
MRRERFLLRDLDVGQKYAVVGLHREAALGTSAEVVCGPGEIKEDFTFKLPRGGVISGKVVDESGVPVVGAVVTMERPAYSLAWFVPPSDVGQAASVTGNHGPGRHLRLPWASGRSVHASIRRGGSRLGDRADGRRSATPRTPRRSMRRCRAPSRSRGASSTPRGNPSAAR